MDTGNIDSKVLQMYRDGESTHTIAAALGTYPNRIKRILKKNNEPLRNRVEAQKNAMEQGRYKHPTQGIGHSEEVRLKISENVHQTWLDLSDTEKEARRAVARKNWANLSADERSDRQRKALEAVRSAAINGSKLELFIVNYLMDAGYEVLHHSAYKVGTEQMELDIFLPAENIVIEVDGPSHYEPIWGDECLTRNQVADNKKNGILLSSGIHILRIRDKTKKITRKIERDTVQYIEESITKLSSHKKPQLMFIEVG